MTLFVKIFELVSKLVEVKHIELLREIGPPDASGRPHREGERDQYWVPHLSGSTCHLPCLTSVSTVIYVHAQSPAALGGVGTVSQILVCLILEADRGGKG